MVKCYFIHLSFTIASAASNEGAAFSLYDTSTDCAEGVEQHHADWDYHEVSPLAMFNNPLYKGRTQGDGYLDCEPEVRKPQASCWSRRTALIVLACCAAVIVAAVVVVCARYVLFKIYLF